MSEETLADDQSHYEISLTGGQAFVGFVLLLLSLAAAFAFGLVIGRGQLEEKLTARKEPSPLITEGAAARRSPPAREAQVASPDEDFKEPEITEVTDGAPASAGRLPADPPKAPAKAGTPSPARPPATGPHYAQLLSTADQKRAEALAVKLIEGGFATAYVERGATDKGDIFRVRIRFPSEGDARVAEPKLKTYVPEVWITREGR
jgi:cell division septation protein DedD